MSLFHLLEQLFKRITSVAKKEDDLKQIINDLVQEHIETSNLVWDIAEFVSNRANTETFLDKTSENRSRCNEIENKIVELSYEIEESKNEDLINFISRKLKRVVHSQYMVTQAMRLVSVKHMGYVR